MKLPIALGVGCMKGYWGVVRGSTPGMPSKSYKFELNFSSRKAAKETPMTKVGYVAIDLKIRRAKLSWQHTKMHTFAQTIFLFISYI